MFFRKLSVLKRLWTVARSILTHLLRFALNLPGGRYAFFLTLQYGSDLCDGFHSPTKRSLQTYPPRKSEKPSSW